MPLQKRKKDITDISTEEKYLSQFSIHDIVQLDDKLRPKVTFALQILLRVFLSFAKLFSKRVTNMALKGVSFCCAFSQFQSFCLMTYSCQPFKFFLRFQCFECQKASVLGGAYNSASIPFFRFDSPPHLQTFNASQVKTVRWWPEPKSIPDFDSDLFPTQNFIMCCVFCE